LAALQAPEESTLPPPPAPEADPLADNPTARAILALDPSGRISPRELFDIAPACRFDEDWIARVRANDPDYKDRDKGRGYAVISDLANGLPLEDMPAALDWALGEALGGTLSGGPFRNLINRWAYLDPDGALPFAAAISDGDMREQGIVNAMGGWMRRDPEAAYRFLMDNACSYGGVDLKDSASDWLLDLAMDDLPLERLQGIVASDPDLVQEAEATWWEHQINEGGWRAFLENSDSSKRGDKLQRPAIQSVTRWLQEDTETCIEYFREQGDRALWGLLLENDDRVERQVALDRAGRANSQAMQVVWYLASLNGFSSDDRARIRPLVDGVPGECLDFLYWLRSKSAPVPEVSNPVLREMMAGERDLEECREVLIDHLMEEAR
jgi:hypothetical protein